MRSARKTQQNAVFHMMIFYLFLEKSIDMIEGITMSENDKKLNQKDMIDWSQEIEQKKTGFQIYIKALINNSYFVCLKSSVGGF